MRGGEREDARGRRGGQAHNINFTLRNKIHHQVVGWTVQQPLQCLKRLVASKSTSENKYQMNHQSLVNKSTKLSEAKNEEKKKQNIK